MISTRVWPTVAFVMSPLAFAAVQPAFAHDDAIYVSINSMSCSPTATTAEEHKYVTAAGRVKFKPGATGTLSFVCPIGPVHSPSNREDLGAAKADALSLTMRYANETFTGTIKAQVRRADLAKGDVHDVLEVQSSPATGSDHGGDSAFARESTSGGTLDFTKSTYWVQFSLARDTVEMTQPDDVSGGVPRERGMAILDLTLKVANIRH